MLLGRCSQDDGAPPLWPWRQVLRGLGRDLPDEEQDDDGGGRFRTWEAIAGEVVDAARGRPLLVVLDDLHWADVASLRVLRLLGETMHDARLLVLGTWRSHPEPADALLDAVETFARRHAVRRDLHGLTPVEAGRVVAAVSRGDPLRRGGRRAAASAPRATPSSSSSTRGWPGRAATCPPSSPRPTRRPRSTTCWSGGCSGCPRRRPRRCAGRAVIGRQFDLATVAAASRLDEDDLLDALDPALAAGLLREDGIDRYLFGHALVRDTIYGAIPSARRARAHARVAEALHGTSGRETEVARHWLRAGPAHASRAWLAAVGAAALARRLHAHEEAADLLRAALETLPLDPDSTARERYDVLMDLADRATLGRRLDRSGRHHRGRDRGRRGARRR